MAQLNPANHSRVIFCEQHPSKSFGIKLLGAIVPSLQESSLFEGQLASHTTPQYQRNRISTMVPKSVLRNEGDLFRRQRTAPLTFCSDVGSGVVDEGCMDPSVVAWSGRMDAEDSPIVGSGCIEGGSTMVNADGSLVGSSRGATGVGSSLMPVVDRLRWMDKMSSVDKSMIRRTCPVERTISWRE